jgi:hypothetical protein
LALDIEKTPASEKARMKKPEHDMPALLNVSMLILDGWQEMFATQLKMQ